ncbi:hypothetical protein P167DRAFT_386375 [Morchella conica CCBAS932]|uniref:Uncharacterized protein n=1 Tax=Morchella conica CCBAS932 TaxID=1392247 RepID=A0A3N4KBC7_9PEZI|nr:hypothetical protein P167DRAFT_386375 [Morchella conica CCBAS932]
MMIVYEYTPHSYIPASSNAEYPRVLTTLGHGSLASLSLSLPSLPSLTLVPGLALFSRFRNRRRGVRSEDEYGWS